MEPSATPAEGYGRLRKVTEAYLRGWMVWRAGRVGFIPIVLNALFFHVLTSLTSLKTLAQIDFPTDTNRRIVRALSGEENAKTPASIDLSAMSAMSAVKSPSPGGKGIRASHQSNSKQIETQPPQPATRPSSLAPRFKGCNFVTFVTLRVTFPNRKKSQCSCGL